MLHMIIYILISSRGNNEAQLVSILVEIIVSV